MNHCGYLVDVNLVINELKPFLGELPLKFHFTQQCTITI